MKRTQQAVLVSTHGMLPTHPTTPTSWQMSFQWKWCEWAMLVYELKLTNRCRSKPWPLIMCVSITTIDLAYLDCRDKNSKLSKRVLHPNTKHVKGKDIFRHNRQPRRLLATRKWFGFLPYIRRKCPSGPRRGRPRSCPGNRLRWWTRQFPCPCVLHVGWTVAPVPKTFFCKVWNENIFFSLLTLWLRSLFIALKFHWNYQKNFHFHWSFRSWPGPVEECNFPFALMP